MQVTKFRPYYTFGGSLGKMLHVSYYEWLTPIAVTLNGITKKIPFIIYNGSTKLERCNHAF